MTYDTSAKIFIMFLTKCTILYTILLTELPIGKKYFITCLNSCSKIVTKQHVQLVFKLLRKDYLF